MPNRFCAICGSSIDKGAPHFGMCLNCYLRENPLFDIPEKLSHRICIDCGSYTIKEDWIKPSENEISIIIKEAAANFLLKPYLKQGMMDFEISIDEESIRFSSSDLINSLEIDVKGILKSDIKFSHQQKVKIILNYELCKNCTNLRGGTYFIATLQLRVKNEKYFDVIKDALDDIQKFVDNSFEKDPRQYVSKIEDQKYGVDLYLSTNELMNHIISNLKNKYFFLLKRTKKLVGRDHQRGKNLYRLKSLIKFLPFIKNDDVRINDILYRVESISKNRVVLRNEEGTKLIKEYAYFFNDKILID